VLFLVLWDVVVLVKFFIPVNNAPEVKRQKEGQTSAIMFMLGKHGVFTFKFLVWECTLAGNAIYEFLLQSSLFSWMWCTWVSLL
jgi:hypothetical protein